MRNRAAAPWALQATPLQAPCANQGSRLEDENEFEDD